MTAGRSRAVAALAGSLAAASVLAAALVGCAKERPPSAFESAYDDDAKPWVEVVAQMPPKPDDRDLVEFAVSGATSYRFGIDRKSLSIGSDGVYRYTLVAISPQGVRNVSYEGIRCGVHQRKIYATARADGTWSRARDAAWVPIVDVGLNRQHAALEREYFCPDGNSAIDPNTIVGRMRPLVAPSEAGFARETIKTDL